MLRIYQNESIDVTKNIAMFIYIYWPPSIMDDHGEGSLFMPCCNVQGFRLGIGGNQAWAEVLWRTGCCPCIMPPLSTTLVDPKEQQAVTFWHQRRRRADARTGLNTTHGTALGSPTPDFSSGFTPEWCMLGVFCVTDTEPSGASESSTRIFIVHV